MIEYDEIPTVAQAIARRRTIEARTIGTERIRAEQKRRDAWDRAERLLQKALLIALCGLALYLAFLAGAVAEHYRVWSEADAAAIEVGHKKVYIDASGREIVGWSWECGGDHGQ